MAQKKIYQPFQFKHFVVHQNKSAMKVGTDGVLLGAWASIPARCANILDIGTGTGLIALMLAQRSSANRIIGIEPDVPAFEEASYNFNISTWAKRLNCKNCDLASFSNQSSEKFDLIISNPPYHQESIYPDNPQRLKARSMTSLPLADILTFGAKNLNSKGCLSIIVPFSIEAQILKNAEKFELYISRITRVSGTEKSPIKRSLIELKKEKTLTNFIDYIHIEDDRHKYSESYKSMTVEFYKMFSEK